MEFQRGKFAKVCMWFTKAKEVMGLMFTAYVFFYLFFGLFADPGFQELNLFTCLQMAFAGFFVGLLRQALIPLGVLNRIRAAIWVASSAAITVGFSLFFQWFQGFPAWCAPVFWALMAFGFSFMIMEYSFELHRETTVLNQRLEQFQSGKSAERTDHAAR